MLAALSLVLTAGGMNGSFAAPMKRIRGWQWEHIWLAWSFLGMLVIPLVVAAATVPELKTVYSAAGPGVLIHTALDGMIWGLGTVLFGLGMNRVGLALGFAIIIGTSSSLGVLIPLVVLHREMLFTHVGEETLLGAGILLAGVAACARAGLLRDAGRMRSPGSTSLGAGIGICLLSGMGSSFMSLGVNEAVPIIQAAHDLGASRLLSPNAVWPILLAGGFAVNAAYCTALLIRHGNLANFRKSVFVNVGLVVTMAILWSGSNFVYSTGAYAMGSLGLVLGWPVFMGTIVLAANVWGIVTGEWCKPGRKAVIWMVLGCLLLVAGIGIVALAGNG